MISGAAVIPGSYHDREGSFQSDFRSTHSSSHSVDFDPDPGGLPQGFCIFGIDLVRGFDTQAVRTLHDIEEDGSVSRFDSGSQRFQVPLGTCAHRIGEEGRRPLGHGDALDFDPGSSWILGVSFQAEVQSGLPVEISR